MEKLERKDPMKRFQDKVSVSKTISGHGVREGSPAGSTNSPQRSPKKPI
jgi:hypothetical protein